MVLNPADLLRTQAGETCHFSSFFFCIFSSLGSFLWLDASHVALEQELMMTLTVNLYRRYDAYFFEFF